MTQTEALKRFLIGTSVENAEGSQIWYVDAATEEDALRIFNEGGADIYASEVEVTATGTPYIDGHTTLDDFGDFNNKALAQPEQESVLIEDVAYSVPMEVACELLRLHLLVKKLKEPEQKPVAHIHRNEYNEYRLEPHDNFDIKSIPFNIDVPLFKAPQRTWVDLTDEQILEIARDHYNPHQRSEISFARAIEAAHGITKE